MWCIWKSDCSRSSLEVHQNGNPGIHIQDQSYPLSRLITITVFKTKCNLLYSFGLQRVFLSKSEGLIFYQSFEQCRKMDLPSTNLYFFEDVLHRPSCLDIFSVCDWSKAIVCLFVQVITSFSDGIPWVVGWSQAWAIWYVEFRLEIYWETLTTTFRWCH
jgi:hypothetical protein